MGNVFFYECASPSCDILLFGLLFFSWKNVHCSPKTYCCLFFSDQINLQLRPKISCFLSIFVYCRPSKCYCFGFAVLALIFSWCTILRWWSLSFGRTVLLRSFKIFWPDSILLRNTLWFLTYLLCPWHWGWPWSQLLFTMALLRMMVEMTICNLLKRLII